MMGFARKSLGGLAWMAHEGKMLSVSPPHCLLFHSSHHLLDQHPPYLTCHHEHIHMSHQVSHFAHEILQVHMGGKTSVNGRQVHVIMVCCRVAETAVVAVLQRLFMRGFSPYMETGDNNTTLSSTCEGRAAR